jgi:hypothetical protein
LIGRSAKQLRALGLTLEGARQLRTSIEDDREGAYAMAEKLQVTEDEMKVIGPQLAPPLQVVDYLIETLGG